MMGNISTQFLSPMKKFLTSITSLFVTLSIVAVPIPSYAANESNVTRCMINGSLQDKVCTPGASFINITKETVCTSGYTAKVRNVTTFTKNKIYSAYGIAKHSASTYEIDHLIPLELGGSNDITNLWPEAASPKPGFREKDKVENYLHKQVCLGAMSLQDAQQIMATDWQKGQVSSDVNTAISANQKMLVTPTPVVAPIPVPTVPSPVQTYIPVPTPVYVPPMTTYTPPVTPQPQSPIQSSSVPAGATAICKDGSYSFSASRSGTCSHHGGVAEWL